MVLHGLAFLRDRMMAFAGGRGLTGHGGVKPDRQRTTALERFVIGQPVLGLVVGGNGSAHALQQSHWIH